MNVNSVRAYVLALPKSKRIKMAKESIKQHPDMPVTEVEEFFKIKIGK